MQKQQARARNRLAKTKKAKTSESEAVADDIIDNPPVLTEHVESDSGTALGGTGIQVDEGEANVGTPTRDNTDGDRPVAPVTPSETKRREPLGVSQGENERKEGDVEITSGQPDNLTPASELSKNTHMKMRKKITRKKSLLDLTKRVYSLLEDDKEKKLTLRKKRKLEEDIKTLERAYEESVSRVVRQVNQERDMVSTTEDVADVTQNDASERPLEPTHKQLEQTDTT